MARRKLVERRRAGLRELPGTREGFGGRRLRARRRVEGRFETVRVRFFAPARVDAGGWRRGPWRGSCCARVRREGRALHGGGGRGGRWGHRAVAHLVASKVDAMPKTRGGIISPFEGIGSPGAEDIAAVNADAGPDVVIARFDAEKKLYTFVLV